MQLIDYLETFYNNPAINQRLIKSLFLRPKSICFETKKK